MALKFSALPVTLDNCYILVFSFVGSSAVDNSLRGGRECIASAGGGEIFERKKKTAPTVNESVLVSKRVSRCLRSPR